MERTIKTIKVTLTTDGEYVTANFEEYESGDSSRIVAPYSPDEHPEFNERVGDELYWWIEEYMNNYKGW